MNKKTVVLRLLVAVRGVRFDSEPGDTKSLSWRPGGLHAADWVPRLVEQARAGQAIDWGGAMVSARDYVIVSDDDRKPANVLLSERPL